MAKFFSGNYGGQLGSTARAAQLIADAGAREGESLREIGSMIKSATDKYGEKRRKEEEKLIAAGAALAAASRYNPGIVKDIEAGTLGEEAQRALKLINDGNGDEKSADRLLATVGAMNSARALKLEEDNLLARTDAQKFENAFNKRTEELDVVAKELANDGQRLINRINGYKERMAEIESQYKDITTNMEYSTLKAQYDLAVEQLDNLKRYNQYLTPKMSAQLDFLTKQIELGQKAAAGQPPALTTEARLEDIRKKKDKELNQPFGEEGTLGDYIGDFNRETGQYNLTVDREDLTPQQISQLTRLESLAHGENVLLNETKVMVLDKNGNWVEVTLAEKVAAEEKAKEEEAQAELEESAKKGRKIIKRWQRESDRGLYATPKY